MPAAVWPMSACLGISSPHVPHIKSPPFLRRGGGGCVFAQPPMFCTTALSASQTCYGHPAVLDVTRSCIDNVMAARLQVLQAATALGFVAIGALALAEWLRRRDPGRGYLALAVGCLGIVSAMGRLTPEIPSALRPAFSDLSLVMFMMSGLALLLFRDTVIPLGRRVKTAAVAITGAVAVAAAAAQLPSGSSPQYTPLQYGVLLALVLVWCLSVGEPSVRMWLVSRHQPAVQQARLRALSVGYGGIVAILLSAVFAGSAATAPAVQLGFALAALAMVPVLYAGFAPPGWLRRAWRRHEEELFQQATRDLLLFSPDTQSLAGKALEWALRMAGAKQGFIAFPQMTIIARHAVAAEEAARICAEIGNQAGIRLLRSGRGATQTAIASPLVTAKSTGMLVLLAGPFTPVFGGPAGTGLRQSPEQRRQVLASPRGRHHRRGGRGQGRGDRLFRTRQRRRIRHAVRGSVVQGLSAAASGGRVRGHRRRARHGAADRGATRRARLGAGGTR